MLAVKLQTPTFLAERDIDRLEGELPKETVERLRRSLQMFRAWVATPALAKANGQEALQHIVQEAAVVAAQFKTEFIEALTESPGALDAFFGAVTQGFDVPAAGSNEDLVVALKLLLDGTRSWVRFFAVHPDIDPADLGGMERVTHVINLGFHADNVMTVCMMGFDGECGAVDDAVLAGLSSYARELAVAYHDAVRQMVESPAPALDEADPFGPSTVQDLLDLPPFGGQTVTVDEMNEAIRSRFEPRTTSPSSEPPGR